MSAEAFASQTRAICDLAEELSEEFVALAFPEDFVAQVRSRVDQFEEAKEEQQTGMSNRAGARGGLSSVIREGVIAGRQMNMIFKNIYKDDPEKLAAWKTTFHTESVGSRSKTKVGVVAGQKSETEFREQVRSQTEFGTEVTRTNGANGMTMETDVTRSTSLSVPVAANGHA